MMKRVASVAALILGALALAAYAQAPARTLKLTVKYTGATAVDEKHRIAILLFDTPDYATGQFPPVTVLMAKEKTQTFTIPVEQATLYAVALLDPKGQYDGMEPPPNGTIVGGLTEPIRTEPGKTTEVAITFDDSLKSSMPGR